MAEIDAVHVKALEAQERMLQAAEQRLSLLEASNDPTDTEAFEKSLKALIAVERYVGRSFTKRQTAVRRDRNQGDS